MHLLITRNMRHIWSSNSLAEIKADQRKNLLKIWFKGQKKIKINVLKWFQKYLVIHPTTVSATGAGHYIDICIKFLWTCVCPPLPGSSYSLIQLSWGSGCTYHQVLNKAKESLHLSVTLNADKTSHWKQKGSRLSKSPCSHEAQEGKDQNGPSIPLCAKPLIPSPADVSCQEKLQVVSRAALDPPWAGLLGQIAQCNQLCFRVLQGKQ